ncbi:aroma-sacti cluster domain-containing protein [Catenulispora pinisilvae]|uniref:aroma-sacti cluster domain-containing protein n=1 Tax=Catenulispora pinisilvae TaxID=2705253 RepID=UPI001E4F8954|nr:aroma-sacti cluster domain-containing protein [Catenulispora pinisilvae]
MNDFDNPTLAVLEAAGFPLATLSEEQVMVLGSLTGPELDLLVDLKAKLDEVEPEVQAHGNIAGGALF